MKRKIYILTLAAFFFASTTGLPLVLHYCEMMESVSLDVCEMHFVKTSCCETENNAEIYFTTGIDACCSTRLVDQSVKDNFVISKSESVLKIQLPLVKLINSSLELSDINSDHFYTDTSPPLLIDNHLYLSNSILLI